MLRICLFLDPDVFEQHGACRAFVNLQPEEPVRIRSVVGPVGHRHAVDPRLHFIALDRNRDAVPTFLLVRRTCWLVILQPQRIKVTAAALSVDAA